MTQVKKTRAETRRLIDEYNQQANEQIAAAREENARLQQEIRDQMAQQRAQYQTELNALNQRIQHYITTNQAALADQLRQRTEVINRQLQELSDQTAMKLTRLHDKLQAQLNSIQEAFRAQIEAVYRTIQDSNERKAAYAHDCLVRLQDTFKRMVADPSVLRFCRERGQWLVKEYNNVANIPRDDAIILITTSLQLIIQAEALMIEAEHARSLWQQKHDDVQARLSELQALVDAHMHRTATYQLGGSVRYQSDLAEWAPLAHRQLLEEIERQQAALNESSTLTIQQMVTIDHRIPMLESRLYDVMAVAQREISLYVLNLAATTAACKHLMTEYGWRLLAMPTYADHHEQDSDVRGITGTALLHDQLDLETMQVVTDPSRGVAPTVRLILRHNGATSTAQRMASLRRVAATLSVALAAPQAGSLASGNMVPFTDAQECCVSLIVTTNSMDVIDTTPDTDQAHDSADSQTGGGTSSAANQPTAKQEV